MSKFDDTVKELKEDIKELEDEFSSKTKDVDETTKRKAHEFVENTEKVINSAINKVSQAIDNIKEDEKLDELLDKVKAKAKEAIDFALDKIDALINNDPKSNIDALHDDIMDEFDKLKETEAFKKTTVLIKEGYVKLNEFLEKPEVQTKIKQAKVTTINIAEKGVEGLKKVLDVDNKNKKTKKSKTSKSKTTSKKKAAK